MKTKNLTPFLFGTKVTSRHPPQPEMAMIVRGAFRLRPDEPVVPIEGLLDQRPLSAETFREEDDERVGECLYPSDFADFKLRADVLLSGTCHAPNGKPVRECGVRFSVGDWSKSLLVVGRRAWKNMGATVGDPEPFDKMPLGYVNGFGGPEYAKNPSGKGLGTIELPNVEYPRSRVLSRSDRPEPAGFGPLNPAWPQHAGSGLGKDYGKAYRQKRSPFYSEDFDWAYFNAAPGDQQLEGYLHGDEEITFQNLHPSASVFSARLPGLRIRAFAKDAAGAFRAAPVMNLDTVHVDLDAGVLYLTWRGHLPVKEDDMTDVQFALIASEKLAEAPLPEAHYRAILETFEADPLEIEARVPGGLKKLAAMEKAAKDDEEHPERTPLERASAVLENPDLVEQTPELAQGLARLREAAAAAPPPPANVAPATELDAAETAQRIRAQLTELRGGMKTLREGAKTPLDRKRAEELERLLDDPDTKRRMQMVVPVTPDEIGPGKDLSFRNLAKLDLSGRDLSGANLEGALLTDANLKGARLVGVNFTQAMLSKADITGADLSSANLTMALLGGVKAAGANLSHAILKMTILQDADLRGATLIEAKGELFVWSGANLSDAKLQRADFNQVFGEAVNFERADFSDTKLQRCSFMRGTGADAIFKNAMLDNASFMSTDLRRAVFLEAHGSTTNWMRSDLAQADFRLVTLRGAQFMETTAVGTKFYGADLKSALFLRACLDEADFEKANLFEANFKLALLNRTRFVDASMYEARLVGAAGKDTDLNGANTKQALFQYTDFPS